MLRLTLLLVALAGCEDSCPKDQPYYSSCSGSATCHYGSQLCRCRGGLWLCGDSSCPDSPPEGPTGSCDVVNASCAETFENSCTCIGPEMQWVCCGAMGGCPFQPPADGELCCPKGGFPPPDTCTWPGVVCNCYSDRHYHCMMVDMAEPDDLRGSDAGTTD